MQNDKLTIRGGINSDYALRLIYISNSGYNIFKCIIYGNTKSTDRK